MRKTIVESVKFLKVIASLSTKAFIRRTTCVRVESGSPQKNFVQLRVSFNQDDRCIVVTTVALGEVSGIVEQGVHRLFNGAMAAFA